MFIPATSKEPPFFSLLIPAFNAEKHLDATLASVETTRVAPLEIIVIDDGSTDATFEIAQTHAKKDSRIAIVHTSNGGYGRALNRGIAQATGDYIGILEADDYLVPEALDQLYAFLRKARQQALAFSPDMIKTPYWRVFRGDEGGKAHSLPIPFQRISRSIGTDDDNAQLVNQKSAASSPGHLTVCTSEKKYLCSYAHLAKTGETLTRTHIAELLRSHPSIWSAFYRRSFLNEHNIRFVEAPGASWADGPFAVETLLRAKDIVFFDTPLYCYYEDNPEASSALDIAGFAPERFEEMMAVQAQYAPHDAEATRALTVVGLHYIERIMRSKSFAKPEVVKKLQSMMRLLDIHDICVVPQISPQTKRAVLRLMDASVTSISPKAYKAYLLKRMLKEVRNNGLGFILYQYQVLKARSAANVDNSSNPANTSTAETRETKSNPSGIDIKNRSSQKQGGAS